MVFASSSGYIKLELQFPVPRFQSLDIFLTWIQSMCNTPVSKNTHHIY